MAASARNRAVIERFYYEMCTRWNLSVADEILSIDVRFRSSLGSTLHDLPGGKGCYLCDPNRPYRKEGGTL